MLDTSENDLIVRDEFFHFESKPMIRLRLSQNLEKPDCDLHTLKAKRK